MAVDMYTLKSRSFRKAISIAFTADTDAVDVQRIACPHSLAWLVRTMSHNLGNSLFLRGRSSQAKQIRLQQGSGMGGKHNYLPSCCFWLIKIEMRISHLQLWFVTFNSVRTKSRSNNAYRRIEMTLTLALKMTSNYESQDLP